MTWHECDGVRWLRERFTRRGDGFVHVWVTMADGRKYQFDVAPDEWAVHEDRRVIQHFAGLPGPPPEPYR